jgi:hypothetical protein
VGSQPDAPPAHVRKPGFALVGDAVGHHDPLTAVGLTMGFLDAMALSKAKSFEAYRRRRDRGGRVPEVLAIALYDIFAGTSDETVAMRKAVFRLWRDDPAERDRTMRLLSGDVTNLALFGVPFLKVLGRASFELIARGLRASDPGHGAGAAARLTACANDCVFRRTAPAKRPRCRRRRCRPPRTTMGPRGRRSTPDFFCRARLGFAALLHGKTTTAPGKASIRCPMLPAEYVLAWHIMGLSIDERRQKRILLHFERTRPPSGVGAVW